MAKHVTRKNGPRGRFTTAQRRQARAVKTWSPPLDVEQLERELSTAR